MKIEISFTAIDLLNIVVGLKRIGQSEGLSTFGKKSAKILILLSKFCKPVWVYLLNIKHWFL